MTRVLILRCWLEFFTGLARSAGLGEDVAIGEPSSSDGMSSEVQSRLLNELLKNITM